MTNPECVRFDETAPALRADVHQCNRTCRAIPEVGRIADQWLVACYCARMPAASAIDAVKAWNTFNPIKRITSQATRDNLAALRKGEKR